MKPVIGSFNDEDYAKVAATLGSPLTLLPSSTDTCKQSPCRKLLTGVGSRPGDNCADLVFSCLFACVLKDLIGP